jgi:hypothetical protein
MITGTITRASRECGLFVVRLHDCALARLFCGRHRGRRARAALLAGLIPAALAGAAFFPAAASAATRSFKVYNLSSFPLKFNGILSGDTSAPAAGSILQPGVGYDDFEQTYVFGQTTQAEASYAVLHNGAGIGTFWAFMEIYSISHNEVYCIVDFGACNPQGTDYVDGDTLEYLDPPGTVHNIPAGQGQAQAATLKELCNVDNAATCTFTPTSETHFVGAKHFITSISNNNPNRDATLTYNEDDNVGATNSIDVSLTAGTKLFDLVDTSLQVTYNHTWTESHGYSVGVSEPCQPLSTCTLYGYAPMVRDTGNFTLTMGNTVWHLYGVYFDQPDPSKVESFYTGYEPLTPQQRRSLPPGATRRSATVPYRTARGARIVRPRLRLAILGPSAVAAGQTVGYRITLRDTQPQNRLVYSLNNVQVVSRRGSNRVGRWLLSTLPRGRSRTLDLRVNVPSTARGTFCITAYAVAKNARGARARYSARVTAQAPVTGLG